MDHDPGFEDIGLLLHELQGVLTDAACPSEPTNEPSQNPSKPPPSFEETLFEDHSI